MVDELRVQLSSREQQLGVLENLILTRELNKQVYPEGRPVAGGLDFVLFRRARRSVHRLLGVHKGVDFAGPEGSQGDRGGGRTRDLGRRALRLRQDGRDQPRQRSAPRATATMRSSWSSGRHGAQGPGDRADGLDRPFDRAASALRSAEERRRRSTRCASSAKRPANRSALSSRPARAPADARAPRPKRFPAPPVYPYNTQFFKDSLACGSY